MGKELNTQKSDDEVDRLVREYLDQHYQASKDKEKFLQIPQRRGRSKKVKKFSENDFKKSGETRNDLQDKFLKKTLPGPRLYYDKTDLQWAKLVDAQYKEKQASALELVAKFNNLLAILSGEHFVVGEIDMRPSDYILTYMPGFARQIMMEDERLQVTESRTAHVNEESELPAKEQEYLIARREKGRMILEPSIPISITGDKGNLKIEGAGTGLNKQLRQDELERFHSSNKSKLNLSSGQQIVRRRKGVFLESLIISGLKDHLEGAYYNEQDELSPEILSHGSSQKEILSNKSLAPSDWQKAHKAELKKDPSLEVYERVEAENKNAKGFDDFLNNFIDLSGDVAKATDQAQLLTEQERQHFLLTAHTNPFLIPQHNWQQVLDNMREVLTEITRAQGEYGVRARLQAQKQVAEPGSASGTGLNCFLQSVQIAVQDGAPENNDKVKDARDIIDGATGSSEKEAEDAKSSSSDKKANDEPKASMLTANAYNLQVMLTVLGETQPVVLGIWSEDGELLDVIRSGEGGDPKLINIQYVPGHFNPFINPKGR